MKGIFDYIIMSVVTKPVVGLDMSILVFAIYPKLTNNVWKI